MYPLLLVAGGSAESLASNAFCGDVLRRLASFASSRFRSLRPSPFYFKASHLAFVIFASSLSSLSPYLSLSLRFLFVCVFVFACSRSLGGVPPHRLFGAAAAFMLFYDLYALTLEY